MSAHVLLNLSNKLWGKDMVQGCAKHLTGSPNKFNQFKIQEHECKFLFIMTLKPCYEIFFTKTSRLHHW